MTIDLDRLLARRGYVDLDKLLAKRAPQQQPRPKPPRVQKPKPQKVELAEIIRQQRAEEQPATAQGVLPGLPGLPVGHGKGQVIGYEQALLEQQRVQIHSTEDAEEAAWLALALPGTSMRAGGAIAFGGGRFLLAPGALKSSLVLLDTKRPLIAGREILPPGTRRAKRWKVKGATGQARTVEVKEPAHNYAWFEVKGARDVRVPEEQRHQKLVDLIRWVVAFQTLPAGAFGQ